MRTNWRLGGLLLLISPALGAVPLCTSFTTLQQYINLGSGGCQAGSDLFSGFSYNYTIPLAGIDAGDPNVSASQVQVAIGGSSTAPTLTFLGNWIVTGGFQSELEIDYTACALDSSGSCASPAVLPIGGSSLSFLGTVEDLGAPNDYPSNIRGNLSLLPFGGSLTTLHPSLYPSACAAAPSGCPAVAASTVFGSVQQVSVGDQFILDSGGTGSGSANTVTLTEISQTLSDAPEPATAAAVGLGLLGCGLAALRKAHRAG